jgi:transcriptional repressor NrdR
MRCLKCASLEDKVIDSRINKDGTSIRRRRECLACGQRFTTTEEILRDGLLVIKRDGRRDDFDRSKMLAGIRRACEKRPIDIEQINMIVTDITNTLQERFDDEIPSQAIGELLMEKLHQIDKIAYVRFASVYKDFRDVNEFMAELTRLDTIQ